MEEENQKLLALAISIASNAHQYQTDKQGKAYILHPLYLMFQCLYDTELAIIAILHDVIEDSNITITDLRNEGFSQRVLEALELLTHKEDDSYEEYIEGICSNYDAIRVKMLDLEHNSSITRLKGLRPKDHDRIEKYHKAYVCLTEARKKYEE